MTHGAKEPKTLKRKQTTAVTAFAIRSFVDIDVILTVENGQRLAPTNTLGIVNLSNNRMIGGGGVHNIETLPNVG